MDENKSELLRSVLDAYRDIPGSLITVLQKAQGIYGYLPQDVLERVIKAAYDL